MTDLRAILSGSVRAWRVDASRSTVTFSCKSLWGLLPVRGRFSDFDGEGQITDTGTALGTLTIQAASLATGIGKRDEHLRSDDFFAAGAHPTIRIAVESIEPTGSDTVELHAAISIRGTTRDVDLPAHVAVLDDGAVRVITAPTFDRHQFGVDGNMLGMVADVAVISADVVFTPG